jgi:hypothetical protein
VASFQKPHHPVGQIALVERVGRQQQVTASGWRSIQDVAADGMDRHRVGRGVDRDGGRGERIDVIGGHIRRSRLRRGDRHQPGAGGDVEHPPVEHRFPVIQQVTRQRLAASPGKPPERGIQPGPPGRLLGPLPQPHGLGGLIQPDFRHQRHRTEPGAGPDDLDRVCSHVRRALPGTFR